MSKLSDILSSGLAAIGEITGDEFTVSSQRRPGGLPYMGTFTEEKAEFGFEDVGTRQKVTRTCVVLKAQFSSKPDGAQRPALDAFGQSYVITAVAEDQLHYTFSLEQRT